MNIYSDFRINLLRLRETIYEEILKYRSPLQGLATQFLESNHLLDEDVVPRAISPYFHIYLPFWLGNSFKLDVQIVESLSLTNYFLSAYIIAKDAIIDRSYDNPRLLLLSDRFLISAIHIMRTIMDGNDRLFWYLFYDCIEEDISFLVDEERRTVIETKECNLDSLNKAITRLCPYGLIAYVKPSVVAAATLAKRETEIRNLCQAIDFYHFAWRLIDDYLDWEDDLEHHNRTLFLNFARNWCGFEDIQKIDVHRFILGSDLPEQMLGESVAYMDKAKESLRNIDCSYFQSFLEKEHDSFLQLKNQLSNCREVTVREIADRLLSIKKN